MIEAFANSPSPIGLKLDELRQAFARFRIMRSETSVDDPDWNKGVNTTLIRFVAQKLK
ncbi:MAG TPA: hypothetical protein VES20_15945 [Bryobacteraceae bacterium]|nr:hypothetical protein [Bryobacteraceae bacterium]